MLRVRLNMLQKPFLLLAEERFCFFRQQFCKSDDRMKWCSEFMTDARHEFALETVEPLGFLLPKLQFCHVAFLQSSDSLLIQLSFGDVANHGGYVSPVLCLYRAKANLNWKLGTILALGEKFETESHRPGLAR